MLRYLRYLYYRALFPRSRDFLNMGMGIEARAERCAQTWLPHLRSSKDFQMRALSQLGHGSVASVLGAGRLLDIDADLLVAKFLETRLYDADPSSRRVALGKFPRGYAVNFTLTEISGVLDRWTQALDLFLRGEAFDLDKLAAFLRELRLGDAPILLAGSTHVFSVNLLSQIPIYWRDRAQALIEQRWGVVANEQGELTEPLQAALLASMARLQSGHLRLLNESGAHGLILIFDTDIEYYKNLEILLRQRLLLVSPESELKNFTPLYRDNWTWEVSPQGIEQSEYGVRHLVQALHLGKL